MYLLFEVAGYINTMPTVAMVMLTAVIGIYLLKRQGLATLTRGLQRLDSGEIPAQEMAEGLLLAVAGAVLITPGFITDAVGFLLLFPPTRQVFARLMLSRVQFQSMAAGATYGTQYPPGSGPRPGPDTGPTSSQRPGNSDSPEAPTTIEGEFQRRS